MRRLAIRHARRSSHRPDPMAPYRRIREHAWLSPVVVHCDYTRGPNADAGLWSDGTSGSAVILSQGRG
jgi:hypothetical protein